MLKHVKQFVLLGWPKKCPRKELCSYSIKHTELSVSYGCLLWGMRMTHLSRVRMVSMTRQFCWLPVMNKDIEMKVLSCEGYATAQ
ncbi:hypothetical protein T4B_5539 [Trichinella pseudospiralis]|uniref:Uncharacterized protein n=1 Tax=Trichinella pseudospiralis TaxID=6337 RepID=A0A0V1I4A7_TRIPS|nr:hypothetical protein T4A_45 [Trichinella pseudospiralis]KRZ17220.1 hypothetical protein T4B_5539 [Trichinella pseudospiralis]KRZ40473.1 hypothetical protein T4C_8142 [Trichinella pseudospiralis]